MTFIAKPFTVECELQPLNWKYYQHEQISVGKNKMCTQSVFSKCPDCQVFSVFILKKKNLLSFLLYVEDLFNMSPNMWRPNKLLVDLNHGLKNMCKESGGFEGVVQYINNGTFQLDDLIENHTEV